jgi:ELWxxDGT repeat protein
VATTRAWTQFDYFEAVREDGEGFRVIEYRNRRYFFATDGLTEWTLWSTDGRPQGSKPFDTTCSGCPESIYWVATVGSKLVIEGYSPGSSEGLFLSDGTPEGTVPFEICACDISVYGVSGPYLFVTAERGDRREFYRTDGTSAGTVRLLRAGDFQAQFSVSYRGGGSWWLRGLGVGLSRLALSDGTAQGTLELLPRQGTEERTSDAFAALALGDGAFFCADPRGGNGFGHHIWFSGGPSSATRVSNECELPYRVATSRLGFWADDYYGDLTRSDGTASGTAVLVPAGSFDGLNGLAALDEQVGFLATEHDDTFSLHRSDGTVAGTVRVANLPSEPFYLSSTGDSVHFFTSSQLWRSDLTAAGTIPLRSDVDPSLAGPLTRYGPLLLVLGYSRISWLRADGSTALVPLVSDPSLIVTDGLVVHQHWAYFWGLNNAARVRLARVDLDQLAATGSATPEILAGFDRPTEAYRGSFVGRLVPLDDGRLAFTARDKKFGEELFVTDGTSSGTRRVADTYPGPVGGVFSDPVPLGGGVVFAAHDGEHGVELWWSDGTQTGTRMVEDLRPGIGSSSPQGLLAAEGRVFFSADDGKIGREFFVVEP